MKAYTALLQRETFLCRKKNGGRRRKISVVDMVSLGFCRVFVSTTGLGSFHWGQKFSKRFSFGGVFFSLSPYLSIYIYISLSLSFSLSLSLSLSPLPLRVLTESARSLSFGCLNEVGRLAWITSESCNILEVIHGTSSWAGSWPCMFL